MAGIGTLEQTAVSRVPPSFPVFGRGRPQYLTGKRELDRLGSGAAESQATDATGLSLSSEDLAQALRDLERQQAERAQETAYKAAGSRARSPALDPDEPGLAGAFGAAAVLASTLPTFESAFQASQGQVLSGLVATPLGPPVGGSEGRSPERTFLGNLVAADNAPNRSASSARSAGHVQAAYLRTAGESRPAPWGSGLSLTV